MFLLRGGKGHDEVMFERGKIGPSPLGCGRVRTPVSGHCSAWVFSGVRRSGFISRSLIILRRIDDHRRWRWWYHEGRNGMEDNVWHDIRDRKSELSLKWVIAHLDVRVGSVGEGATQQQSGGVVLATRATVWFVLEAWIELHQYKNLRKNTLLKRMKCFFFLFLNSLDVYLIGRQQCKVIGRIRNDVSLRGGFARRARVAKSRKHHDNGC